MLRWPCDSVTEHCHQLSFLWLVTVIVSLAFRSGRVRLMDIAKKKGYLCFVSWPTFSNRKWTLIWIFSGWSRKDVCDIFKGNIDVIQSLTYHDFFAWIPKNRYYFSKCCHRASDFLDIFHIEICVCTTIWKKIRQRGRWLIFRPIITHSNHQIGLNITTTKYIHMSISCESKLIFHRMHRIHQWNLIAFRCDNAWNRSNRTVATGTKFIRRKKMNGDSWKWRQKRLNTIFQTCWN